MSVWAKFNTADLTNVTAKAAKKGLTMSDVTIYNTNNSNLNASRLGFASLNLKEQEKAITILSKCLK